MIRGDDSIAIQEAFLKIKEDMNRLNEEIYTLKQEQKNLVTENLKLKQNNNSNSTKDIIEQVVKETLKTVSPKNRTNDIIIKKFNKKRKSLVQSRILSLAKESNMTLPEIKELIVDNDALCSKATFYRYVDKMKKKNLLNTIMIDEMEVLVSNNLN